VTRTERAMLVALVLVGCGSSIRERARAEASSHTEVWEPETLRLPCAAEALAVEPFAPESALPGFAARAVGRMDAAEVETLRASGTLHVAWCPDVGCCGRSAAESGAETVVVHCASTGDCRVVSDTLGDCLTVYCATY
jgi:hypothetical protein